MSVQIKSVEGFEEIVPCDVAHVILGDYLNYHHQYKHISKRTRIRFERRDWEGIQKDYNERIVRYTQSVDTISSRTQTLL